MNMHMMAQSGPRCPRTLKEIKTHYKRRRLYHPRKNVNEIIIGQAYKIVGFYLDQALFACQVRAYATTRTSPYRLVYSKHLRLVSDDNHPLDVDTPVADHRPRIEAVQSARQEASQITYERALREETLRDRRVQLVLVRHENPKKFESK